MNDFYYPPLPEGAAFALDIILQNIESDPEYLLDAPYSGDELVVLDKLVTQVAAAASEEDEPLEGGKWARLERESNDLFKLLTDFSKKLDAKDNTETMAYFRTATALLDKIVGIQERTANLKQISRFHDTVLSIMEDEMDATQRTKVMERLQEALEPST